MFHLPDSSCLAKLELPDARDIKRHSVAVSVICITQNSLEWRWSQLWLFFNMCVILQEEYKITCHSNSLRGKWERHLVFSRTYIAPPTTIKDWFFMYVHDQDDQHTAFSSLDAVDRLRLQYEFHATWHEYTNVSILVRWTYLPANKPCSVFVEIHWV